MGREGNRRAPGTLSGLRGRIRRRSGHSRSHRHAPGQPGARGRQKKRASAGRGRHPRRPHRHHPVHARARRASGRVCRAFFRGEMDRRGLPGVARGEDAPGKRRPARRRSRKRVKGPVRAGLLRHGLKSQEHHVFHRVSAAVRVPCAAGRTATGASRGHLHRACGGQRLYVRGARGPGRRQVVRPALRQRHPQGRRRRAGRGRGSYCGDAPGGVRILRHVFADSMFVNHT